MPIGILLSTATARACLLMLARLCTVAVSARQQMHDVASEARHGGHCSVETEKRTVPSSRLSHLSAVLQRGLLG